VLGLSFSRNAVIIASVIDLRLDRQSHRRSDAQFLGEALDAPSTLFVPISDLRVLLTRDDEPKAQLLKRESLSIDDRERLIFLGTIDGTSYFAVPIDDAASIEGEWSDLRSAAMRMKGDDVAILAYGRAMMHWHDTHRFCGRCGFATRAAAAGHERICPNCEAKHFPRTDPAVITIVSSGERALFGRQASWPDGMFSTLAGFVEPGETLEQAVAREVFEEAGVRVRDVRYFGSQPWPFPASLMVGFTATADNEELNIDGNELSEARWLTREEAVALSEAKQIRFPPRFSIARELIESWLAR
jgi:NAD+ diphosphatase